MYITSTIKTKSSRLAKPVLCLGTLCSAFLTGLNRVSEYRNHCSDVVAGFILGSAVALFLVRRRCWGGDGVRGGGKVLGRRRFRVSEAQVGENEVKEE